nr:flagellar filament capping protein FliD [uncultured Roseateles sp.]
MADINPTSMAQQLATAYTQSTQTLLDAQTKSSKATATALTKLQGALQAFDSAMKNLSAKGSLAQLGGSLSNPAIATVSVAATASAGSYPLFVEQTASNHQIAFQDLPAVPVAMGGSMAVQLGSGAAFNVNLSSADADSDGTLSQAEIARAINQAPSNSGLVTAMVMTVGGQTQLMLSSGVSGAAGAITLDTTGLNAGQLKTKLSGASVELAAARDAVVWLGAQGTGVRMQQASNSFTAISGVTLNLTQANKAGDAPVTLTVAKDDSATTANVKGFVDAFNTLEKTLDDLTSSGSAKDGVAAAAFASDAGVRALRDRLGNLLRQGYGGLSLRELGISIDRNGSLALDTTRLNKTLTATPDALSKVFGSASAGAASGLMGALSKSVDQWTNLGTGQIKQRQSSVQTMQKAIGLRQTRLDTQYEQSYKRYLAQFTQLQNLQSQLGDTTSMLAGLSV